jgi:hypothetical protein
MGSKIFISVASLSQWRSTLEIRLRIALKKISQTGDNALFRAELEDKMLGSSDGFCATRL